MNVYGRKFAFDVTEQVEIPLLVQLRMMASLHQNLNPAECDCFFEFFIQIREAYDVGIIILFSPIESAEFAINVTNIGVVDVTVHNVSDNLVSSAFIIRAFGDLPSAICQCAQFFHGQRIESPALSRVNALPFPYSFEKPVKGSVVRHGASLIKILLKTSKVRA
jgi:hypothetical protein